MNLSDIRFPRQLEADETVETIRKALMARTVKLWPGGELKGRYPDLPFAYIILDRGYDAEEIHQDICEHFGIIPIIIRKKMVYPERFTKDGFQFCPWGMPMKPKGIEYDRKRIKYACFKACQESEQMLPLCDYLKEQYRFGYISHTYFTNGYRKFGPVLPHSAIYQKLKPLRTGIGLAIARRFHGEGAQVVICGGRHLATNRPKM